MMRGYLILIGFAGLFSAIVGGTLSTSRVPAQGSSAVAGSPEADVGSGSESVEEGTIELTRSSDGHFYADVEINGATVRALVDTGASAIALSRDDARSAGLAVSVGMPSVVGQGADGEVHGEFVTLDRVTLGHLSVEGLPGVVLNSGEQTLLGQNFLSKFESVEIQGDRMLLR